MEKLHKRSQSTDSHAPPCGISQAFTQGDFKKTRYKNSNAQFRHYPDLVNTSLRQHNQSDAVYSSSVAKVAICEPVFWVPRYASDELTRRENVGGQPASTRAI